MAADMFLKLDGIKGESHDDKHKDEIELTSFSWGASQLSSHASGAGSGTEKANLHDLSFTHYMDKSSPDLAKVLITGKHIKTGVLTVRKAGEKPLEYFKFEMKDVLVTSVSWSGGQNSLVSEAVSLSFAAVKAIYTPQKPDGSGDTAGDFSYDVKTNKMA